MDCFATAKHKIIVGAGLAPARRATLAVAPTSFNGQTTALKHDLLSHDVGAIILFVKEQLLQLLASRQKPEFTDTGAVPAAVLVPLFFKDGQCHILFTKRTEHVPKHRGEISFPGGAFEPYDGSLLKTALRESHEEIGLREDDIEVLGALNDLPTLVSGYVIYPFIGVIPYPHTLNLNPFETESVIEAPVIELIDTSRFYEETRFKEGKPWKVYFYQYGDKLIWGATANILRQFLSVFKEAMGNEISRHSIPPLTKLP